MRKNIINSTMRKYMFYNLWTRVAAIAVFFLAVVIFAFAGLPQINLTHSLCAVLGIPLLLFFPGFFATLIFFPGHDRLLCDKEKDTEHSARVLDIVERITLAILLSIIISSAIVFGLHNFFQLSKLTPRNLALAVVFINVAGGAIAFVATRLAKKRHN